MGFPRVAAESGRVGTQNWGRIVSIASYYLGVLAVLICMYSSAIAGFTDASVKMQIFQGTYHCGAPGLFGVWFCQVIT